VLPARAHLRTIGPCTKADTARRRRRLVEKLINATGYARASAPSRSKPIRGVSRAGLRLEPWSARARVDEAPARFGTRRVAEHTDREMAADARGSPTSS
jgi:hypothetical protein